jgi:AraC-like DNA-binding protein
MLIMNLSLISIVQLIILFNAFLLAGIIFSRYKIAHPSTLVMAVILSILGLQMLGNLYLNSHYQSIINEIITYFHQNTGLLYGPLLYFYIAHTLVVTNKTRNNKIEQFFRLTLRYWQVHLFPYFAFVIASSVGWEIYNVLLSSIFISICLYLIISWYLVIKIKVSNDKRKVFSSNQSPKLLLSSMSLVVSFNLSQKLMEHFLPELSYVTENLVYLSLLILLVTLFFVSVTESKRLFSKQNAVTGQSTTIASSNNLENDEEILIRINRIIETEQLYLNPQFSLKNLARKTILPERVVSMIINTERQQSFTDFINDFRIKHAQRLLVDVNFQQLGILDIALESGFNAKSTFNRVFKKHTEQTAKEYRNNLK